MRDETSLMYPPIEDLLEKIPDKYALVLTATKRAKHIIMQNRLNPTVSDELRDDRKPLSIALQEIADGVVDSSNLDLPEPLLDDYVDDEMPVYVDLNLPTEEELAPEAEPEFVAEAAIDDAKPEVDDLANVADIEGLDLDSDD